MEHPFINNLDDQTATQLSEKITELYKKLNYSARMGNAHLCDQIRLAINSYESKYQQKIREELEDNPYKMNIDIK